MPIIIPYQETTSKALFVATGKRAPVNYYGKPTSRLESRYEAIADDINEALPQGGTLLQIGRTVTWPRDKWALDPDDSRDTIKNMTRAGYLTRLSPKQAAITVMERLKGDKSCMSESIKAFDNWMRKDAPGETDDTDRFLNLDQFSEALPDIIEVILTEYCNCLNR